MSPEEQEQIVRLDRAMNPIHESIDRVVDSTDYSLMRQQMTPEEIRENWGIELIPSPLQSGPAVVEAGRFRVLTENIENAMSTTQNQLEWFYNYPTTTANAFNTTLGQGSLSQIRPNQPVTYTSGPVPESDNIQINVGTQGLQNFKEALKKSTHESFTPAPEKKNFFNLCTLTKPTNTNAEN